ncbi:DUF2851 family protein [Chloroflexota bacterium]
MANVIPESLIVNIWQHQLLGRTDLTTEEGEPIKVIYPGRINDDQGADLRDAIIATGQRLIKGDVEIHVKSSSWWSHRHHQDPMYNRVILHVVFWHDNKAVTNLQNGGKVPTLVLHKYVKSPTYQQTDPTLHQTNLSIPCHQGIGHSNTDSTSKFLDSAGEQRFLDKATKFQADLAQTEARQSLYQGIMGALGYAKNKLPFLELARRLPLQVLESITRGIASDEECLAQQQALLLGTAGLLPSQRSHGYQSNKDDGGIDKFEKLWDSSHQTESMSENDWRLFKVRPNNFPTRRMVGISYLTLRYREKGILEEAVNKLRETPVYAGHHELEKLLMVSTDGYWTSHLDLGSATKLRIPTLIGSGRAADILVNVLLPFALAWVKLNSQPELARKVLDFYHHYPRLVANTIEKHMRNQLGIGSNLVNSAQRQQGLIHIYQTLCSQGKCHCCPLHSGTL